MSLESAFAKSQSDNMLSEQEIFSYEVVLDAISYDETITHMTVKGYVRHTSDREVAISGHNDAGINIGIRLLETHSGLLLQESRLRVGVNPLQPFIWTEIEATLKLPHDENVGMILKIDFVKEHSHWFEDRGGEPFEKEISMPSSPKQEALHLEDIKSEKKETKTRENNSNPKTHVVFDVSDLIQYFYNSRLPTGIQRVQIEVITSLIFAEQESYDLSIACFTKTADRWLIIPPLFFNHICKLALVSGDSGALDWLKVLKELAENLASASTLVFSEGAYLINLGTSWWLQNYFLHVRHAKATSNIKYVPYIHDCIPIITPEHCIEQLTRDFITWALGAFQHADHMFANSIATANDVKRVARFLGHAVADPVVVTLDADFRSATRSLDANLTCRTDDLFAKHNLTPGRYALFVSTIESRKNHLGTFNVWLRLIKQFGPSRIPKLVCVGNRGWLNDAIFSKLQASKILQDHVLMLSKISDPDLQRLYEHCRFTVYPSTYEGWGLPVTESLCYSKVPLLARTSSLPEAGGEFAEYFDIDSESQFYDACERLIFDDAYLKNKEAIIIDRFRPRSWQSIASQIIEEVKGWKHTDVGEQEDVFGEAGVWPLKAPLGTFCGIYENTETVIWPGMFSGEIFRQGNGWWWPEPWGCWTKPLPARIAFRVELENDTSYILYVGVRGNPSEDCTVTLGYHELEHRKLAVPRGSDRWITVHLDSDVAHKQHLSGTEYLIDFRIWCDKKADFSAVTNGTDTRIVGMGLRGFMICSENDMRSRQNFVESITLGSALEQHRRRDYLSITVTG